MTRLAKAYQIWLAGWTKQVRLAGMSTAASKSRFARKAEGRGNRVSRQGTL